MNKLVTISLATGLLAAGASAKVSFSLDIEAITEGDINSPTSISDSGLIVLVVDTGGDSFQLPAAGSIATGNDEVVTYWDLDDYNFTTADVTLVSEGGVQYGSNWEAGDELALFWFPNLSSSNMTPAADEVYGVFSDALGLASGDGWAMPADGTPLHSLKLFTSAATALSTVGDLPAAIGHAAYAVNNPPSSSNPASPSLAVENGGGKSTLTWTATGDPSGFVVQRKSGTGDWESIGVASGTDTSFEDTTVKPGAEYEYRLYSVSAIAAALSNIPAAITSERSVFGNVSARSRIVAGDPATQMFGGVIVEGNDPTKNIVLQAIGESFFTGQSSFVDDPEMTVYRGVDVIASNDDWMSSANALALDGAMAIGNAVTLGDSGSKDSSELIQATLNQGHAFAVSSKGGDSGDVLLGIFNADSDDLGINDNRIVNLSARGFLSNEAGSLFAGGMIIKGNVPKEVLVMAWGPYLSDKVDTLLDGLTIVDPELVLFKDGVEIARNDDWESQTGVSIPGVSIETDEQRIRDVVQALGYPAFDPGSTDSMLLMTVDPGAYTFSFEGKGGTGIGLIAIDEVELD